jgi:hypothetical protein
MPKPSDLKLTDSVSDHKVEWRKALGLPPIPRVGRPASQTQRVLDALIPVLEREKQKRARDPKRPAPRFTQGQLKKMALAELSVEIDERTLRDVCKMLRLVCGDKTMKDWTLAEWRWLIKHWTKAHKKTVKAAVMSAIEKSRAELKKLNALQATYHSPVLRTFETAHTRRRTHYERVLTLFPSK